ncbi:hypothetical protein [Pelagibacterium luteolum]|uniref:Uncharacterized protein n=1 Tax=Pelagibacterium luteolum TaxID=440168 RepID=A0A1G7Y225_9HYPH|nr:hypothetical protein [Pelagibacterium luteolum]SDG90515.1 hypothetical protein SAMN04487974_11210 [Pelagibacterium luteolum]
MIEFAHITSVSSALKILRSKVYRPAQPQRSDAGLYGLIANDRSTYSEPTSEYGGARLHFEWTGPVTTRPDWEPPRNPSPNMLNHHLPFRVFVPIGTTRHLRLTGLEITPGGWANDLAVPWHCTMFSAWDCRQKMKIKIQAEIEKMAEMKPNVIVSSERGRRTE